MVSCYYCPSPDSWNPCQVFTSTSPDPHKTVEQRFTQQKCAHLSSSCTLTVTWYKILYHLDNGWRGLWVICFTNNKMSVISITLCLKFWCFPFPLTHSHISCCAAPWLSCHFCGGALSTCKIYLVKLVGPNFLVCPYYLYYNHYNSHWWVLWACSVERAARGPYGEIRLNMGLAACYAVVHGWPSPVLTSCGKLHFMMVSVQSDWMENTGYFSCMLLMNFCLLYINFSRAHIGNIYM